MTKMAKNGVIAPEVKREIGERQAPPRADLLSRMGNALRGLVRRRGPKDEDGAGTAASRGDTSRASGATRYPMDTGIARGLPLLFGNPEGRRR